MLQICDFIDNQSALDESENNVYKNIYIINGVGLFSRAAKKLEVGIVEQESTNESINDESIEQNKNVMGNYYVRKRV